MRTACLIWIVALVAMPAAAQENQTITPEQAWALGWPTMQGPYGNFRAAQTGVAIVDDLSKARFVWETEDRDFGRAKHTTGAFKGKTAEDRAQKILDLLGPNPKASPGGWAAPIIAEGKLFVSTFKPAGKIYDIPPYGDNPNNIAAKAHLEADDMLIAADVKTGKTLWKAREPGGFVWGVGKRMGFQVAPVYHDGKVFSMGTTGRVFAYQAADGKKLWETAATEDMLEQKAKHLAKPSVLQASARYNWQQSLVFAGGLVIVPRKTTLEAMDPKTGKTTWTLEKIISRWVTPSVWKHGGKGYLLCPTERNPGQCKLNLVDPATGKVLWTVDGLDATFINLAHSKDHVLVNVGSAQIAESPNGSWPRNAEGKAPFARLGAYKITPEGATLAWKLEDKPGYVFGTGADSHARPRAVIRNGLIYHSTIGPNKETDRRLIIIDEKTGKVLADQPRDNDTWFQVIGDKLLHCRDWSHGKRATWYLYTADPENFKRISGPWATKQPLTTSYQVLMEAPVIAGHIFWRTETGTVVCYDLRKQ